MTELLPVFKEQIRNSGKQAELLFSQVTIINCFVIFVAPHPSYPIACKTEGQTFCLHLLSVKYIISVSS